VSKCYFPWRVPVKQDMTSIAPEPTSVNAFMPVRDVRCELESGHVGDHTFTEVYTFTNTRPVRCTYVQLSDLKKLSVVERCCLEMGHDGLHDYTPIDD
jgi:hypothetical protein